MIKCAILLLVSWPALAIAGCYPHPNLILCWETQEGNGGVTADSSLSGLTGTFANGPAWALASKAQSFGHTATTMTTTNMGNVTISFPGTSGVEVDTPNTSIFDFSGNKPHMVAFSFQNNPVGFPMADNKTFVGFTDPGNNGWGIYMNTEGQFIVAHIANANSPASPPVRDTNPHRLFMSCNGTSGALFLFLDGKQIQRVTGFGDMNAVSGAQKLALALQIASAAGVWNGKLGNLAIYNAAYANPNEVAAFALNEYLYWQGGGGE